jgi:hypothetical protein
MTDDCGILRRRDWRVSHPFETLANLLILEPTVRLAPQGDKWLVELPFMTIFLCRLTTKQDRRCGPEDRRSGL